MSTAKGGQGRGMAMCLSRKKFRKSLGSIGWGFRKGERGGGGSRKRVSGGCKKGKEWKAENMEKGCTHRENKVFHPKGRQGVNMWGKRSACRHGIPY